jgi:hypothetical protein
MTNAKRDENNVPGILAVLNSDGQTVVPVEINPTTHALSVDNNTTGADNGPSYALRDENNVPTLLAVSSVDGVTPVALYVDSDGKLLIDET